MQETPLQHESLPAAAAVRSGRYIYIACPWTPVGGGMYKVADYLIQSQAARSAGARRAAAAAGLARRRPAPSFSLWILLTALAKIVRGRIDGRLAGVHVNMAERLSLLRKGVDRRRVPRPRRAGGAASARAR